MENHINLSFKAPYYTLNEFNSKTKNIWIVCHGYGQLAEHFIKRFDVLDDQDNFILALQGLSRFYTDNNFGRVGASWMTKEDRLTDLENQRTYIDGVLNEVFGQHELTDYKINFLGFSQGASMIGRIAAYLKVPFDNLVIWAGGFPTELTKEDFSFVKSNANLKVVLGKQDQYFKEAEYLTEINRMESIIGLKSELVLFEGTHELRREVLKSLELTVSQVLL
jgi:predicted esterase